MEIHLRLYGALRDRLPAEKRGRDVLAVTEGTTLADVLTSLNLDGRIRVSVNGSLVEDWEITLNDGDEITVFRSAAGG